MPARLRPGSSSPTGVVFFDKPAGLSSFAAIGAIKRAAATRKVGHTGTLDPFATGLLITLLGRGTRCARYFTGLDKEYHAVVRFGSATDTDDATGQVIRDAELPPASALEPALCRFQGTFEQLPPDYSALHVDGRRAHEIARSGERPAVKTRMVTVERIEITNTEILGDRLACATLALRCSAGTYVRSIARDLGAVLGSAAHAAALRRTAVGPFTVEEAVRDGALRIPEDLRELADVLARLPGARRIEVSATTAEAVLHGRPLSVQRLASYSDGTDGLLILEHDGETLAVGMVSEDRFAYDAVLVGGAARD